MSKNIYLTNGGKAMVDDEDFEYLNKLGWHRDDDGYAYRKKYLGKFDGKDKYRNLFLHRLIFGEPEGKTIDHINGDPLDNRKENLRVCTQSQNIKNMKMKKNNTSGYKGVYFSNGGKRIRRWVSQICVNGKLITNRHLTVIEAARKYNEMAVKYYGEFARLNEIIERGDKYE